MENAFIESFAQSNLENDPRALQQFLQEIPNENPLKRALRIDPVATSAAMNSLLDEIRNENRRINENNAKIIDAYNRDVFRYLQTVYGATMAPQSQEDPKRLAELASLKERGKAELPKPKLSATHIHALQTLCPQAAPNAFACLDATLQSLTLGDMQCEPRAHRVCRVYHPEEVRHWKSNALLSVFPDKSALRHAMDTLRAEGVFFVFSPHRSLFESVFTVCSQTTARGKRGGTGRRSNAANPSIGTLAKMYTCLGGYYCDCDAFYNKVFIGTSLAPRSKYDTPPRGNHGATREHGQSKSHALAYRRELFCKHALATQLILACEPQAVPNSAEFDISCFFGEYIDDPGNLKEPHRIYPSMGFFYDCLVVSAERYANIFQEKIH